jgi:hypothetical protein
MSRNSLATQYQIALDKRKNKFYNRFYWRREIHIVYTMGAEFSAILPIMPPDRSQDKIDAAAARDACWKLFSGRCAYHQLNHPAACIHEIIPRSRRPRSYWKDPLNMIPICDELHQQVHREGAANWSERLTKARRSAAINIELGY